mmetsp:Transcript_32291/g.54435  ORF Transcript_32291/g.54435 Transcript_32291/m.54435 type:complete len:202 (+) Transcript_32291:525-1130(+)
MFKDTTPQEGRSDAFLDLVLLSPSATLLPLALLLLLSLALYPFKSVCSAAGASIFTTTRRACTCLIEEASSFAVFVGTCGGGEVVIDTAILDRRIGSCELIMSIVPLLRLASAATTAAVVVGLVSPELASHCGGSCWRICNRCMPFAFFRPLVLLSSLVLVVVVVPAGCIRRTSLLVAIVTPAFLQESTSAWVIFSKPPLG